jgi:hypothetical protein
VDIRTVEIDSLTDIRDIRIDIEKSVAEKMRQYASQTANIFINRHGDYIVKVTYADTDVTFNDKMRKYIRRLMELDI